MPMALEAPEMGTRSAEARLHLVGDEEPARLADRSDPTGDEARWIDPDAIAGEDAVDQERRDADPAPVEVGDSGPNLRLEETRPPAQPVRRQDPAATPAAPMG